jgi:two-component system chemotaxis response regulator CheY
MPLRVLIVDDSVTIRSLVAKCLEQAGHTIAQCADGAAGLRELGRASFDLVITDFNMPVMDGVTLIRKARALPAYSRTPMLVLTTEMSPEKKNLAREAGASAWLLKPFNPGVLLEAIRRLLPAANAKVGGRA